MKYHNKLKRVEKETKTLRTARTATSKEVRTARTSRKKKNKRKMSSNKAQVKAQMVDYATKWSGLHPNTSQTTVFRRSVPLDPVDFSETFRETGLSQIFTGERLRTGAGFNCNFLFRSTQNVPDIPLYSDVKNTLLAPLGEPGRDVNKNKIAHLMVVPNGSEGAIDFNLMLPSTSAEMDLLEKRVEVATKVTQLLKDNSPISECGPMVASKAEEKGLPLTTSIREYFAHMIDTLPEDVVNGQPGYKLLKGEKDEFEDSATTLEKINMVYDSDAVLKMAIQPPTKNTQIVTHIHLFMVDEEQPVLTENYVDVEVIREVKEDFLENVPLVRTRTPPPPIENADDDDVALTRCASSRNYAHRDD